MFTRLLWKLLRASRGRLVVALVALVSGAAVISALLNLQFDIERKLTQEFRTLGANVVIAPPNVTSAAHSAAEEPALIDEASVWEVLDPNLPRGNPRETRVEELNPQLVFMAAAPYLYFIGRVAGAPVVVGGTQFGAAFGPFGLEPTWKLETRGTLQAVEGSPSCVIGRNVAKQLKLSVGSPVELQYLHQHRQFVVHWILDSGAAQDSQIFVDLRAAQSLLGVGAQASLIQLRVNGTPKAISQYIAHLAALLPQYEVRPIRQVTEAEGELLNRIRLLILSMVILILLLTGLCVLATMAALAMERREDVGLMKVLGGSISRIVGLFLAEVGVLGAVGGLAGCIAGVALSHWMGQRVFGTAISARWEIFPLTVALMVGAALAGALPLRRLGNVKPAVILRGE
jgi:putative ABC transport system permease protein